MVVGKQVGHQRACPARRLSTAAASRAASGADPVSFSTTERPTSIAMPRTSESACFLGRGDLPLGRGDLLGELGRQRRWRSAASAASRSVVSFTPPAPRRAPATSCRWNAALASSASDLEPGGAGQIILARLAPRSIATAMRGSPILAISK